MVSIKIEQKQLIWFVDYNSLVEISDIILITFEMYVSIRFFIVFTKQKNNEKRKNLIWYNIFSFIDYNFQLFENIIEFSKKLELLKRILTSLLTDCC